MNMKRICLMHFVVVILLQFIYLLTILVSADDKPDTKPIISFCLGQLHACSVFDTKQMKCWGSVSALGSVFFTAIGDEPEELGNSLPYVNMGASVLVEQVSCGAEFICIRTTDKDMKCVGSNLSGQIGLGLKISNVGISSGHVGDKLPIVNLGTGLKVIEILAGNEHSCILLTGNKVKCLGNNQYGQLGQGNTENLGDAVSEIGDKLPTLSFGTNVEVFSLHASSVSFHTCIILSAPVADAKRIKCWGFNQYYQLGYGDTNNRGDNAGEMGNNLQLVDLGTESKVKQLVLGALHTCAILVNDIMKCWGSGSGGDLNSGATDDISAIGNLMPVFEIDSGKALQQVSAGFGSTCVVFNDSKTMKCVGDNYYGQLGQGDQDNRGNLPTNTISKIPAINLGVSNLNISSIHSSYDYNCVIFSDSSVKCFGRNEFGQLLIGNANDVGDNPNEMGGNLKWSVLFSPVYCDYQSAKLCKYDYKCMWRSVNGVRQCTLFDCTTLNKGKCTKLRTRCKWNNEAKKCSSK